MLHDNLNTLYQAIPQMVFLLLLGCLIFGGWKRREP